MKRKLLKTILCLIICSSTVVGLFSVSLLECAAVSQETQDAIDKAEEEEEELENELDEQRENKGNLETQREKEESKLESLKKEYQSIESNLDALNKEKEQKEIEIVEKEKELEEAVEKQEKQYADMKKRIQYMYEKPQVSLFGLFLKDFSFAEILNRVDDNARIQEYDRIQLKTYTKTAEDIEEHRQELETSKKELEKLISDVELKQAQVAALQRRTSLSIRNYLDEIASAEEEIGNTKAALEAKSAALKQLYAKAQAEEDAARKKNAEEAYKELQEGIANGTIKPQDAGIIRGNMVLNQSDMEMLIAMIYCESRGESYEGQLAVGHVIMNRVRSNKYPNDLEQVLRQSRQFEPAGSGRFDIVLTAYRENIPGVIGQAEWESCKRAAEACVNGTSNVLDCLFFRTHKPVPQLAENLQAAGVPYWIIGNHIFYYSWVNY